MNTNYPSIIVPLDGTKTAENAIPFAIAIARRGGSRVTLVHVHEVGVIVANAPMIDSQWEDDRATEMYGIIQAMAERLSEDTGLGVAAVTLRGPAAQSLVQYAVDQAADLIVLTTHGRSGFSRAWFGSVAERVIHSAMTPVLVVRAGDDARTDVSEPLFRHVLLPIDLEQSGAEAMQRALTLGVTGETLYTLLTVRPSMLIIPPLYPGAGALVADPEFNLRRAEAEESLERIAGPARSVGAAVDVRVVTHDQAASAILEAAQSSIDLIVIPTHARSSLSRALLGSVVDKVLRGATVPLLLFRAAEAGQGLPATAAHETHANPARFT